MKKLSFLPFLFAFQFLVAQNVEVDGTIKIMEGAQAGYILTSDAEGVATWSPPCLLYTSPSPRDLSTSRMPSSA